MIISCRILKNGFLYLWCLVWLPKDPVVTFSLFFIFPHYNSEAKITEKIVNNRQLAYSVISYQMWQFVAIRLTDASINLVALKPHCRVAFDVLTPFCFQH